MGTEDWIFKGTKLITNTKKQRLKIQSRGWIFKNTILKKRRRGRKERKNKQTSKTNKQKTKPQELLKNKNINHKKTI